LKEAIKDKDAAQELIKTKLTEALKDSGPVDEYEKEIRVLNGKFT
jgi:hypothetical protein